MASLPEVVVEGAKSSFNLGGLISGALGFLGGERTNSANASMADRQMAFQERMANTSYQRAVKDLKKAGLNPMLAYGNGGAAAPPGASAQMIDSSERGSQASSAYLQRELLQEQSDLMSSQKSKVASETAGQNIANEIAKIELKKAQSTEPFFPQHAAADVSEKIGRIHQMNAQIEQLIQAAKTGKSTASQLDALATSLGLDAEEKRAFAKMWKDMGEGGAVAKSALPFLQFMKSMFGK